MSKLLDTQRKVIPGYLKRALLSDTKMNNKFIVLKCLYNNGITTYITITTIITTICQINNSLFILLFRLFNHQSFTRKIK